MAFLNTTAYTRRTPQPNGTVEIIEVHKGIVVLSLAHQVSDTGVYVKTIIPTYTIGDMFVLTSEWDNNGSRVMVLPDGAYALQAVERVLRDDLAQETVNSA